MTLSAKRWTGASLLCASSTMRTISPIAVSPPGLLTSIVSVPFRLILPAETWFYQLHKRQYNLNKNLMAMKLCKQGVGVNIYNLDIICYIY